jgi:hypothetical protein
MEKATTTQYGLCVFSAGASMHHTGPASRTFGRSAVGLRPILDTNPLLRRAPKPAGEPKRNDQTWVDTAPLLQE